MHAGWAVAGCTCCKTCHPLPPPSTHPTSDLLAARQKTPPLPGELLQLLHQQVRLQEGHLHGDTSSSSSSSGCKSRHLLLLLYAFGKQGVVGMWGTPHGVGIPHFGKA
jgi:hypothetical protein